MAYAFDDSGSEQNTGNASLLGKSVSPSRSLRNGLPTSSRLVHLNTHPANARFGDNRSILTRS